MAQFDWKVTEVRMTRYGSCLAWVLLSLATLGNLGCGNDRRLQSVALTPAVADAKNFPNGQVQITATGTFSKPPSPVKLTSADISWCVGTSMGSCAGNIATGASVDQNGLAQCVSGFTGTATILAGKATPSMIPDIGSQMTVFGTAQLSCP
jgi:hypothetical protein